MKKLCLIILTSVIFFLSILIAIYLWGIPTIVKTSFFKSALTKTLYDSCKMEVVYDGINLKTYLKPEINLSIKDLVITKYDKKIVNIKDFNFSANFKNILNKTIKLNKITAKTLDINIDELFKSLPKKEAKETKLEYKIDFYNSIMVLNELNILYTFNGSTIDLNANNIQIIQKENNKVLSFCGTAKIKKGSKTYLNINTKAQNEIILTDDSLNINDLKIDINKSKINLLFFANTKTFDLKVKSDKFYLKDIFSIIKSDIALKDGETVLSPLKDEEGKIKFNINLKNENLSGKIVIDNTKAKIKDLSNIPLNIQKGTISITKDKINFDNLIGYWGKNKNNKIKIYGDIKDYYKTFDTQITIDTKIKNEFLKDYLAKLINNTVLSTNKPIGTRIIYKSKNNIMDIVWLAKISKGTMFGIEDQIAKDLAEYDRAIKGDFHIENNIVNIKNINYYIAPDIHRGVKIKPILTLDGKLSISGKIYGLGFAFARELPSEVLNLFTREKTFKKGTVKGKINILVDEKLIPHLYADVTMKKVLIPSQRLWLKYASVTTNKDNIFVDVAGRFKRAKIELKGTVENKLLPPFIIKDFNLTADKIDIERFMASVNSENIEKHNDAEDVIDDDFMFDTNFIRIKNGKIKIKNGKYKELTFGNVEADMSLDDKGVLRLKSNKFDIAEGTSTLKIMCDLKNIKYYIKLGVKDINSDLMAKVLLNLDKEISGKAKGLIELNCDKTLKMNGDIKFAINDGAIGKIGIVEYLLKVASIFRNPVVMINPTTIMDIISIPEGKFSKINGEIKLKNNVAYRINIKSYSSNLSALIKGRYDMNEHDASLRIYTRFSSANDKLLSFLRNISINKMAREAKMTDKNDLNYYSAELEQLPAIDAKEDETQIFLTTVEGDVEHNNFLSALKKLK